MRIPVELTVVFVAGLFGLIPLIVQIVSTRAQRRDRMTRLNHLQAELEFLEKLNTLQGEVGARDEAAKPQTKLVISNALSKLLDRYNKLSEVAPSGVVGDKEPSPRERSFFRRALLLYRPNTVSGWIWHTIFYIIGFYFVSGFLLAVVVGFGEHEFGMIGGAAVLAIPEVVVLLILQRFARRNARRYAAQFEARNT